MWGFFKRGTTQVPVTEDRAFESKLKKYHVFKETMQKMRDEMICLVENLQSYSEGVATVAALFLNDSVSNQENRAERVEFLNITTTQHAKVCRNFRDPLVTHLIDTLEAKVRKIALQEDLIAQRQKVKQEYDYYAAKLVDIQSEIKEYRAKLLTQVVDSSNLNRLFKKKYPGVHQKYQRNKEKKLRVREQMDRLSRKIDSQFATFEKECLVPEFESFSRILRGYFFGASNSSPRKTSITSRMAKMAARRPPPKTAKAKKPMSLKREVKLLRTSGGVSGNMKKNGQGDDEGGPPTPPPRRGSSKRSDRSSNSSRPTLPVRTVVKTQRNTKSAVVSPAREEKEQKLPTRPPRRKLSAGSRRRATEAGRRMIRESLGRSGASIFKAAARSNGRRSKRFSVRVKPTTTRTTTTTTKKKNVSKKKQDVRSKRQAKRASVRMAMPDASSWRRSLAIRDAAVGKLHKTIALAEPPIVKKVTPAKIESKRPERDVSTTKNDETAATYDAVALYSYEATDADEISMEESEKLEILDSNSSAEWWLVRRIRNNQQGLVPASYVQLSTDTKAATSEDEDWSDDEEEVSSKERIDVDDDGSDGVVLYDYDATESDELSVREGMLLKILDADSSKEWALVEISGSYDVDFDPSYIGRKGLIPSTYLSNI